MILAIVGKSAAGKTVTGFELSQKFGFKKIITYTTRAMRPNEKNGEDYWFVTNEEFDKLSSKFADIKTYTRADGIKVRYGFSIDDSEDFTYIILDPFGYLHLRMLNVDMVGVYIHCRDSIRVHRSHVRGDADDEIRRRIKTDEEDFQDIEQYVEYVVDNEYENEVDKVAAKINELYREELKEKEG